jgi:hypothetical protein
MDKLYGMFPGYYKKHTILLLSTGYGRVPRFLHPWDSEKKREPGNFSPGEIKSLFWISPHSGF